MTFNTDPIIIEYSDAKLSILVEEFVIRQMKEFSFESVCSYVLYWAMEDGLTSDAGRTLYASKELRQKDKDRIARILDKIVKDGRITRVSADDKRYMKQL